MRISTSNSYDASLQQLMKRQDDLSSAQEQLTTGKRVNRASDDPAAAARAERALAAEKRAVAGQRAVDASKNAMTLTESALGDATDLLQQVRETLIAAGNATYTDAERKGLSDKISELRKQLMAVANRADGAGTYLFGGQGAGQAPFLDAAGGVVYQGGDGEAEVASDEALPITTNGDQIWMQARSGNGVFDTHAVTATGTAWIDSGRVTNPSALTGSTYSIQFSVTGGTTTYSILQDGAPTAQVGMPFKPGQAIQIDGMSANIAGNPADLDEFTITPSVTGQTVFDTLDKAIADLKTPLRNGTQIAQSNADNLANLDQVMANISGARTRVGETLNRIDGVTGRLDSLQLSSKTARSDAEDLDMTSAISDFANQQTGYDASLKAYTMVQKLSLFNYLSGG
ncbi:MULTISPECIES: flagellar hook-associated protein FlgL [unclassified Rhizobacter]|uniref:flagellar hook-associated protein FlgL n=1 Tax=unclassified Rhizobacter TaxID=2640088 RepID=UPI00070118C1|nr:MULTISPECIES: flagellar hook-associated protein FlgL [unclassified Rhizobacter]KQU71319.1 flagellar hook protein [Rhizobacter sp. Root29]KQW10635.1 flagellar hook protein [Rhizobacter sp. Root1238]KRB24711.1 flagellar hook protein [Rhizobacter sp. Root16D2]